MTNHWNASNTNTLITGLSGIAGTLIAEKQAGQQLSPAANQLAAIAQQTAAAALAAQQPTPNPTTNYTPLILGGAGLVVLIVLFLAFKK